MRVAGYLTLFHLQYIGIRSDNTYMKYDSGSSSIPIIRLICLKYVFKQIICIYNLRLFALLPLFL